MSNISSLADSTIGINTVYPFRVIRVLSGFHCYKNESDVIEGVVKVRVKTDKEKFDGFILFDSLSRKVYFVSEIGFITMIRYKYVGNMRSGDGLRGFLGIYHINSESFFSTIHDTVPFVLLKRTSILDQFMQDVANY